VVASVAVVNDKLEFIAEDDPKLVDGSGCSDVIPEGKD